MFGRVAALGNVDDRRRAHLDETERGEEYADIGIVDTKDRRQGGLDIAVVIGIEQPVRHDVADETLIGMAVGVDEARNDDAVRGVDDCGGIDGDRDIRPDLANLAILDQQVRLRRNRRPGDPGSTQRRP